VSFEIKINVLCPTHLPTIWTFIHHLIL
jgi:hypothetical protein